MAAVLLSLALPSSASAYGRSETLIDQAVTLVAGKPVDASCAASDAEWTAEVERIYGPGRGGIQAYAELGGSRVRLAPWVCRVLDGDPPGTSSPERRTVGAALNILAHEATHARGIADEATASCAGLHWTDDLAWRVLGLPHVDLRAAFRGIVRPHPLVARYVAESRAAHALLLPSYRTICP